MDMNAQLFGLLRNSKEFWLRDQMWRASLSIHSNIAEGYDRGTNKQFVQFLSIARGSCSELRSQLIFSKEVKLFPAETCDDLINRSEKITAMLNKLIVARKK